MMRAPLLALGLMCSGVAAAAAQSCGDGIDRLARQYDLDTSGQRTGDTGVPATPSAPPATTESRGVTGTERLGPGGASSSGDVVAPGAMPPSSSQGPRAGGLTPDEHREMTTQLAAARQALQQGKADECLDRLRDAEAVVGVPSKRSRP